MFNGQAEQDRFVLTMLQNKKNGFFVELGSQHPTNTNNSYYLETKNNWKGIMIEYEKGYLDLYKQLRPNSIHVIEDAQQINYQTLFESNNVPQHIDYLQIDLDVDNGSTLNTLYKLDNEVMNTYKFATITFEHDMYSSDSESDIWAVTRRQSREIFLRRGYVLVFPDVQLSSSMWYRGKRCGAFEDWYVHPELVHPGLINKYKTNKSYLFTELPYEK